MYESTNMCMLARHKTEKWFRSKLRIATLVQHLGISKSDKMLAQLKIANIQLLHSPSNCISKYTQNRNSNFWTMGEGPYDILQLSIQEFRCLPDRDPAN